jgi:hypothetical protein
MTIKIRRRGNRLLNMLPLDLHPLKQRQLPRRGDNISNLPPIHLLARELVHVHGNAVVVGLLAVGAQHLEEIHPHGAAAGLVEGRVVQGDLDAGLEGCVEGADAVAG